MDSLPKIGIWGPTQAGKTTYLAALQLAINRNPQGWKMFPKPGDEETTKFAQLNTGKLYAGRFPQGTDPGDPKQYTFHLIHSATSNFGIDGRFHEIVMLDAAGIEILGSAGPSSYFQVLSECDGLLLMVDPTITRESGRPAPKENEENYYEVMMRLLNQLLAKRGGQGGMIDMSLAVCATKIDKDGIWESFANKHHNNPRAFLSQLLGDEIINHITAHYRRHHFFAVSVVGRYITASGDSAPNIITEGDDSWIADMNQWQPYEMLSPLMWLFDEIEWRQRRQLSIVRRGLQGLFRAPNYRPEAKA